MDEKSKGTQKDSKNSADNSSDQIDTKTNSAGTSPNNNNNNNNSELSNSGSSISNISSAENNDVLQDLNCNEKSTKRKSNCSNTNKEDGGNSDKTKGLSGNSNVCPLTAKEDGTILVNVKKEENSLSPMSPVGFDSIPNPELNAGCNAPSIKTELSSHPSKSSNNEKSLSPGNSVSCKEEINANISNSGGNAPNTTNSGNINNVGLHSQPSFASSNTGSSISNCLEYMQQQNHIFVFSTQLANKSAESVLSGQFQTIIAYHCTQPSTKNFLEEFFMKNPMKMSKLPRNMLSMGHGGNNNQWASGGNAAVGSAGSPCGGPPKAGPKAANNNKAMNFNLLNANVDQKPPIGRAGAASANVPGFLEGNDNEAELLHCWESNRNAVPGDVKIGDNIEHPLLGNKNATLESKLGIVGNDQIPSLQGVKVPDENLTPQQRQHREEQLAKLKKMNQFLFPENDSTQAAQQLNKMANDNAPNGMNNLMMNLAGSSSNVPGLGQMNPTLRNNMLQNQKQASGNVCESDNISVLSGASEQLNSENMVSLQGKTTNLNCEPLNANMLNLNMPCGPQPSNMLMSNINETSMANNGAFNQCGSGDEKIITNSSVLSGPQDMGAMDWPKLQNQYMDERLKGSKPPNEVGINRLNLNSNAMCSNVRPNLTSATGASNAQRSGQGPPPPYHSTQRSASVPIATQSPNPSSPNNPTSNLSLPSPASAGGNAPSGVAMTTNSPNVDMGSVPNVPCSSANSAGTALANSAGQINKGGYPHEGTSPLNNNNNTNRNRNNHSQLNSNPSTPLSHMSPKDLDAFNTNNGPEPQQTSIDGRFPSASPGFNFPPHIQNSSGNVNTFKAQLERQNSAPGPNPPFGRRTENMPLNPNSSRTPQNKLGGAQFDPISSLAQMSQQLTSCVSSGVGSSPSNVGCNELNMPSNIGLNHQNMDGMLQNMDSSMIEGGNIPNLPSQISGSGSGMFGPNNCNMNAIMMGSINPQHRLLNPKMCGSTGPPSGFNSPGNNCNPGNFHGVLPPNHRLRMPGGMNFNNFNVSPNIQVKASTPNTIQYMPVRPQNNNNMRAPPSLDFLQRYANPSQMSGGVGPNVDGHAGSHLGQINNVGVPGGADGNKMVNNLNAGSGIGGPGMNFFQHCNQMEPDDMNGGNGLLPGAPHDVNVGMIRGLRPIMRQHSMGPGAGNTPQRMMAPNSSGPVMQYPGGQPGNQDALDCGDMTNLFGSGNPSNNPSQLFHISGGSHKPGKAVGMVMGSGVGGGGICTNLGVSNPSGLLPHEHNGMPSPINQTGMMGPNMMSNASGNGPQIPIVPPGPNASNMNYKPFVGPASNDLKYAQQYHSFQQQLYATSTRSQQQNGSNITSVAANVQNSNTPFFVNK